jgi:hypothetical protein
MRCMRRKYASSYLGCHHRIWRGPSRLTALTTFAYCSTVNARWRGTPSVCVTISSSEETSTNTLTTCICSRCNHARPRRGFSHEKVGVLDRSWRHLHGYCGTPSGRHTFRAKNAQRKCRALPRCGDRRDQNVSRATAGREDPAWPHRGGEDGHHRRHERPPGAQG